MRQTPHHARLAWMILLFTCTVISCSRFGKPTAPSTDFATFVKAYTGGVITDHSGIRVILTSDVPGITEGTPAKEGLLSFSPSLKGGARWISANTLEFVPEERALKAGQTYRGTLALDKILKIDNRNLRRFPFSFMVATKEAAISVSSVVIPHDDPQTARVEGFVSLSEPLEPDQVKAMIEADYPGETPEIVVTPGNNPVLLPFSIGGLTRQDRDNTLKIKLRPGNTGFKAAADESVTVPAREGFRILSARMVEAQESYVDIQFSQPLEDMPDNAGLITLDPVSRCFVRTADNQARIYFEGKEDRPLNLFVSDAVKSLDGTRLGQEYRAEFQSDRPKPAVEIPLEGNILPDTRELILPFRAVNLKAVDLRIIKIYEDNVLMFLQDNDLDGSSSLRRSGRLVYKRCIRLDADPSKDLGRWQDFSVDLSGLFKQEPGAIYRIRLSFNQDYSLYGEDRGTGTVKAGNELLDLSAGDMTEAEEAVWDSPSPYYYFNTYDWDRYEWEDRDNPLKPSYYMDSSRFPECNLMTSNLGLVAQYAGGDRIWVAVSDILSSKPVFGVNLDVYNYQLQKIGSGKTDANGLEEIALSGKPFALVARRNNATSYLRIVEGFEKSLSRFDVGGKKLEKGLKSFIYGERGVWRPSDTLHVTLILQDKGGSLPEKHPAVMELYTPQGQFYSKQICANGTGGFYAFAIPTRPEDPTGIWNAWFKVGGASFHKSLRIESVKPNRLKIDIGLENEILSAGDRIPVTVTSSWLTGAIASGLPVKASMTLSPGGAAFKDYKGYRFTDPTVAFSSSEHSLFDTRLDGNGVARLMVNLPTASDAPGMLSAGIVCTVEEPGGDASFTTLTLPFSPFRAYVGIKSPEADGSWLETDRDLVFKLAVIDKDGRRVSGHNIEYRIFKLDWSWWWESRAEDLDSYVNGTRSAAIASGRLVSGTADLSIPLRIDYPEWGRYLVYAKDLDSGHACGDVVFIDWPASRGRSSKTDPNALTMLSFSMDKPAYEVGETATVYIPGAVQGRALVTLENASTVLDRKWVETAGNGDTRHSFKVTQQMAPNFYVHVTLVQPHRNTGNDLPIRLYGVQPVTVENKASHLEPVIRMADAIHPEEEFTVRISEKNGKPMTYTLAIVDEGLLDLTSFKTPDPWAAMYEREALGVKTWDLYDQVIGAYSGRFSPMLSIGGDESVQLKAKKDNRFNPVVKFLGPFTLTGSANTHKIRLPMYVGSVRVMVVAGQDGAFGNADKTVPVRSPLMVLPTLPRVIAGGEKVVLPVNVFAMEDGVRQADVTVRTEGPLRVVGTARTSLAFEKPGDKLARFELLAEGEGTAKVTVTASGSGHTATETITIPVRDPAPAVTRITRAMIGQGASRQLALPALAADGQSHADLSLTSFPSIPFDRVFRYMADYSYSCTEQLSARGLTLVYLLDLLSPEHAEKAREMIPSILQNLYTRQLADGGFAYWSGATNADEWVTSMAGQFMTAAAGKGFEVNKGVLGGWKKFQARSVQNYRHASNRFLNDLSQAYRLYTLAGAGSPDNGSMNRLKEAATLSPQARWMLASAYALCGKKNIAKEMLSETALDFPDYASANLTFGSSLRDKALALEAYVLQDELPAAMELATQMEQAFTENMYSTQEAAFASVAMSRLAEKVNTGTLSAEVTQGGRKQEIRSAKSTFVHPLDPQGGEITVENHAEGPIYATLLTVGKVQEGTATPAVSNGLRVQVTYAAPDGSVLSPASIRQGTDFTAIIRVTNPSLAEDYTHLALTHTIPSGWEIYNERLLMGVASADAYDWCDIRDDRTVWYFDLPRGTSKTFKAKLRAAYEGSFLLPSVTCEAMYNARVNACTSSGHAAVTQ